MWRTIIRHRARRAPVECSNAGTGVPVASVGALQVLQVARSGPAGLLVAGLVDF